MLIPLLIAFLLGVAYLGVMAWVAHTDPEAREQREVAQMAASYRARMHNRPLGRF